MPLVTASSLVVALALGVLAMPPTAGAQQAGKVYRIGRAHIGAELGPVERSLHEVFLEELRKQGFVEGRNLVFEHRFAGGKEDRHAQFMAEFVQMKVDLIAVSGSAGARAAKQATSTIPIVFTSVANPEQQGLVASLARPGGHITQMSNVGAEWGGKLLQLAKEAVPERSRVAILWNPDNPGSELSLRQTDVPAARALGMTPILVGVRGPADLERAFETIMRERAEALYVHLALWAHRARIMDFASKNGLPAVGGIREFAPLGALLTYGPSTREAFRRAATYVAKILKGAKPANLPVEQPTKFELVVNLKTAKALGLTIPQHLILQADELIE